MGVSETGLLSRGAVVGAEDAAEPLAALDHLCGLRLGLTIDQPIAQALMIALQVIMRRELFYGVLIDGARDGLPASRLGASIRAFVRRLAPPTPGRCGTGLR